MFNVVHQISKTHLAIHRVKILTIFVCTCNGIHLSFYNTIMIMDASIYYTGGQVQNEFVKLQITLYQRLANMIVSGDDGGVEAVGKAFDLYRSCMDAATIENLGVTPLLNVIRDSLGT